MEVSRAVCDRLVVVLNNELIGSKSPHWPPMTKSKLVMRSGVNSRVHSTVSTCPTPVLKVARPESPLGGSITSVKDLLET